MPDKPKIVILAEAKPKPKYSLFDYVYGNKEGKEDELPKALRGVYDTYTNALQEYEQLDKIRRDAFKLVTTTFQANNPNTSINTLKSQDFEAHIANPVDDIVGKSNVKRLQELSTSIREYEREFNKEDINPRVIDDTFIKEAKNVQSKYPDAKVINFYKGTVDLDKVKDEIGKNDTVLMFGHHGGLFGGFTHKEMTDVLNSAPTVTDCYMGSCNFDDIMNTEYKNVKGKTFYYRPNTQWLGYNPQNTSNLLEGMFTRYVGKEGATVSDTPTEYKVQKFKRGGVVINDDTFKRLQHLYNSKK